MQVRLTINGQPHELDVAPHRALADVLRDDLALTGTKVACGEGTCGTCTVLVDGRAVLSCLTLAGACDGADLRTVEGSTPLLERLRAAFTAHDGFQCGFCTPGQICSATAMLAEIEAGWPSHVTADVASQPRASVEEVSERMSGNLCRCSAYPNIVDAIMEIAGRSRP
jgi:xanthine dehydrogenase YagT iron-sulfur-binding subunit